MRLTRDWELSSSENKRWKPNGQRRDWSKLPFEGEGIRKVICWLKAIDLTGESLMVSIDPTTDISEGANSIKATDYGSMGCVDDSESQFEAKFKSSAQCAKSGSCLDY